MRGNWENHSPRQSAHKEYKKKRLVNGGKVKQSYDASSVHRFSLHSATVSVCDYLCAFFSSRVVVFARLSSFITLSQVFRMRRKGDHVFVVVPEGRSTSRNVRTHARRLAHVIPFCAYAHKLERLAYILFMGQRAHRPNRRRCRRHTAEDGLSLFVSAKRSVQGACAS